MLFDAYKLYPKKLPDSGYIRSKKIILCFVSVAYLLGLWWGGGAYYCTDCKEVNAQSLNL